MKTKQAGGISNWTDAALLQTVALNGSQGRISSEQLLTSVARALLLAAIKTVLLLLFIGQAIFLML